MYNTLYIIIICFADDTWLSMKIDVAADYAKLQEDLNAVIEWSTKNNMQLHEDKFELLSLNCRNDAIKELPFGNKNCHYDTANGVTIYPTDSTRDLGVIISEQICGGKKNTRFCCLSKVNVSLDIQCIQGQRPGYNAHPIQ